MEYVFSVLYSLWVKLADRRCSIILIIFWMKCQSIGVFICKREVTRLPTSDGYCKRKKKPSKTKKPHRNTPPKKKSKWKEKKKKTPPQSRLLASY